MTTSVARVRRLIGALFAVAFGIVATASVAYLAGLIFGGGSQWGVFAGGLALPRVGLSVLTALALATLLFAWAAGVRRRGFVIGGSALVTVLAVALVLHLVIVPPTRTAAQLPAAGTEDGIRVLAWNVRHGDVDAAARAQLIRATAADVAVFLELTMEQAESGGIPDGYRLLGRPGVAIVVLVADRLDRLGPYRVVAADEEGTGIVLEPDDSGTANPELALPRIVAVHVMRISLRGGSDSWAAGLDWVAAQCTGDAVALGDFNASVRNMPAGRLGSCTTVAGLAPSWPTSVSHRWGGAIDHVMTTPQRRATSAATLEVPGAPTDHRPVFAELVPAD